MLVHLEKLQELLRQLIREVDSWVDTPAATPLSATARQRWLYLRYHLQELYRRHEELIDQVPASALETAQQQPVFWRGVEQDLAALLRLDAQLDGVTLTLDKLGREQATRPQRGQLRYCAPLEDMLA